MEPVKKKGSMQDQYPGTMAYLAREVFLDRKDVSPKSDQYALAVTLYQWLASELPYKGITGIEMYKAFKKGCRPITEFCPELPQSAADALHRALADEPEKRFETSSEFANAFVTPLPSRTRASLLNLKNASTAFLVIAASVFLLTAGSWLLGRMGQPNDPTATNQVGTQTSPEQKTNGPSSAAVDPESVPKKRPQFSPLVLDAESHRSNPADGFQHALPPSSLRHTNREQLPRLDNQESLPEKEENPKEKFERYLSAAQRNALKPMQVFELAQMFETGKGTAPNFKQAFFLYRQLADRKFAAAQLRLGQLYESGTNAGGAPVLKPDAKQSASWYQRAARNGQADAQFWLGKYFEKVARTENERQQAYNWYEKAALQGNPDHSTHLADFCARFSNPELARKWQAEADKQTNELDKKAKQTTEKCEADLVK